jgi:hypothetical protein
MIDRKSQALKRIYSFLQRKKKQTLETRNPAINCDRDISSSSSLTFFHSSGVDVGVYLDGDLGFDIDFHVHDAASFVTAVALAAVAVVAVAAAAAVAALDAVLVVGYGGVGNSIDQSPRKLDRYHYQISF